MAYDSKTPRLARRDALSMSEVVKDFIAKMRIAGGLNRARIYSAWDKVTGAGPYTIGRSYSRGALYITLASSVVRSQLYLQKEAILLAINKELASDPLFTKCGGDRCYVKNLILK